MKKIILIYSLLLLCQSSLAMKNLVVSAKGHNKNNEGLINLLPLSECNIYGQCMFTRKAVLNEKDTSCVFSLFLNTKTNVALVQKDEMVFARVLIQESHLEKIQYCKQSNQRLGFNNQNIFICVGENENRIAYEFNTLTTTDTDSIIVQPILGQQKEATPAPSPTTLQSI